MNLMELAGAIGGITGAIKSASVGFSLYGWVGLILGIPIGFIGGVIISVSLVFLVFFILIQKEKVHQRLKLKGTFGKYWSSNKKEKWIELSSNIVCNEQVEGRVICKFYYGVYIDTNHGFPALLNTYQMIDDIDKINIGDTLLVFIKCLDNNECFIEVSQKLLKE